MLSSNSAVHATQQYSNSDELNDALKTLPEDERLNYLKDPRAVAIVKQTLTNSRKICSGWYITTDILINQLPANQRKNYLLNVLGKDFLLEALDKQINPRATLNLLEILRSLPENERFEFLESEITFERVKTCLSTSTKCFDSLLLLLPEAQRKSYFDNGIGHQYLESTITHYSDLKYARRILEMALQADLFIELLNKCSNRGLLRQCKVYFLASLQVFLSGAFGTFAPFEKFRLLSESIPEEEYDRNSQEYILKQTLLNLLNEINKPDGDFRFIHKQKNPIFDRVRTMFSRDKDVATDFYKTKTYLDAVKRIRACFIFNATADQNNNLGVIFDFIATRIKKSAKETETACKALIDMIKPEKRDREMPDSFINEIAKEILAHGQGPYAAVAALILRKFNPEVTEESELAKLEVNALLPFSGHALTQSSTSAPAPLPPRAQKNRM